MRRPAGLAPRLLGAQLTVILVAGVALVMALVLIAPGLFAEHLRRTGEDTPEVELHAREAFASSMSLALVLSAVVAVSTAVLLSWLLSRRVARPIAELSESAERIAAGDYDVSVPSSTFSREISTLADSFRGMAEQLRRTDQVRGQLLADLAHELRTPLATLEAHVDGMQDGVVATSEESFDVMRAQISRLGRLATDIRQAADAQEHALGLQLRAVTMDEVLTTAVRSAAARYQADGVELTSSSDPRCGRVTADPERIQQVLGNLLDNALRHTPSGGRVQVTCQPRRGGGVVVQVSDSGEGIPPDQLNAVFDRFHRGDPARGGARGSGSGLGLTIARAIVVDHGGTLTAHSDGPGRGTTMRMALPAAPPGR